MKSHIPGLTSSKYQEIKHNNNFLLSTIKMCKGCSVRYPKLTFIFDENGNKKEIKDDILSILFIFR